jgi:hypothetical protein
MKTRTKPNKKAKFTYGHKEMVLTVKIFNDNFDYLINRIEKLEKKIKKR